MRLAELLELRPVPGAGLLLTVTRRCPLRCAHCSTDSSMDAEEPAADRLLAFTDSFSGTDRPEVMMLTGGEPLLLPELTTELARSARRAGTRTALLSGMFFAREGRLPTRIRTAVAAVDHFSASLDAFHEREVPRAQVFSCVRQILDRGTPVSFHLTGSDPEGPYLADAVADIRRSFADQVPMLVNTVRAVGRAASWAGARSTSVAADRPQPCAMAAWPVVASDGTVLACCNQRTVDRRPAPEHLRLGHIAEDDWPAIHHRLLASPALRVIRTAGPVRLHDRYAADPAAPGTAYCTVCHSLGGRPEVLAGAARDAAGAVGALVDRLAGDLRRTAGPAVLLRQHGCARYAELVSLPESPTTAPAAGSS